MLGTYAGWLYRGNEIFLEVKVHLGSPEFKYLKSCAHNTSLGMLDICHTLYVSCHIGRINFIALGGGHGHVSLEVKHLKACALNISN